MRIDELSYVLCIVCLFVMLEVTEARLKKKKSVGFRTDRHERTTVILQN